MTHRPMTAAASRSLHVRRPAWSRPRRPAAGLVLATALTLTASVGTSSAEPATRGGPPAPTPVQADPALVEVEPTSGGGYLAWVQYRENRPARRDVTFGPYQLNAPGTSGTSPAFVVPRAYYLQRRGTGRPGIHVFALFNEQDQTDSERRRRLRNVVNGPTFRGQPITILGDLGAESFVAGVGRGDRLTYRARILKGRSRAAFESVMFFNRTTAKVRELASYRSTTSDLDLGQMRDRHVTWVVRDLDPRPGRSGYTLVRRDTITGRQVSLVAPEDVAYTDPAVSRTGALYYWRHREDTDAEVAHELVRDPVDGPEKVIATVTAAPDAGPSGTFVRDQGRTFGIFYSFDGDIYEAEDPYLRRQGG